MECNLDISKLKPNAVLYRNAEGKIICVTKDEFLKEELAELAELKIKVEQEENKNRVFKETTMKNLAKKEKEINDHLASIRKFIEIMKGENHEKDTLNN